MKQEEVRKERIKLERRIKIFREALIKSAERLIQLESICKHEIKKGEKACPYCGKVFKKKGGSCEKKIQIF
jgi:hypothetical protein